MPYCGDGAVRGNQPWAERRRTSSATGLLAELDSELPSRRADAVRLSQERETIRRLTVDIVSLKEVSWRVLLRETGSGVFGPAARGRGR